MRIWDIDPGYLNRGSLLAEHRELHALYNVVTGDKGGFESHEELKRWRPQLPALVVRHKGLVVEMALRGIGHRSPLPEPDVPAEWPETFVDAPHTQFEILAGRYVEKPSGRILFPKNLSELWAQHKYSVMARDPAFAKQVGRLVADETITFAELTEDLVHLLRETPNPGRLRNALDHMWGYVNDQGEPQPDEPGALLASIQRLTYVGNITYLQQATALGELGRYV